MSEQRWRRALHAGIVPATTHPQVTGLALQTGAIVDALRRSAESSRGAGEGLELAFAPSLKLFDGRHANNLWLQELPDPMTKICWDNAALVSPSTARDLGVSNGDYISIVRGERRLEKIVAWIQPGHADGCVTLHLGHGREAQFAGRYANGDDFHGGGFDVYPLRTTDAMWIAPAANVVRVAGTYFIAQTQDHDSMEGRPLSIDATLDEYRAKPEFARFLAIDLTQEDTATEERPPLGGPIWKPVDYSEGYRWGMAIDLSTCTGCNACVVACQAENNIPSVGKRQVARGREMHWLRIDRYFVGTDEAEPQVALQPIGCQHCEEAPCENVCPVNATVHSPEGLNDMAYNRCIGTRYCANNCPYKVRRFNYLSWHGYNDDRDADYTDFPEVRKLAFNPNVTVRMRGVMEKCSYCVQRIQVAKIAAKNENRSVREGDIQSACQQACPAQAIAFGDLNNASSRVAQMVATDRRYTLLAELGTRPRTTFLPRIRNENSVFHDHQQAQLAPAHGRLPSHDDDEVGR
jgi:molybdopterin-containing oxidoreductase family iron-sulfur binding subunit